MPKIWKRHTPLLSLASPLIVTVSFFLGGTTILISVLSVLEITVFLPISPQIEASKEAVTAFIFPLPFPAKLALAETLVVILSSLL